jgi:hypothetical protein
MDEYLKDLSIFVYGSISRLWMIGKLIQWQFELKITPPVFGS